jgi:hypothetical protein
MSEHHPPASPQEPRTLEMRVAAIEERLAQLSVTEEEMRAYQKVAALMAGRPVGAGPLTPPGSPSAGTETTGGPGPSIPAAVLPHLQDVLLALLPPIGFPTVPVLNAFLIGGFPTLRILK